MSDEGLLTRARSFHGTEALGNKRPTTAADV
jgi:hypothetical protein